MSRILDLAQLRSFLLIAEGRSFAEAAELVGRSPSAVSLHIQKLEEAVGASILRRNARGVEPTLAGERLLGYARRLLALNDETLAAFRPSPRRSLRIGVTQDIAESVLPALLRRFAGEHPEAELILRIDRSLAVIEAVQAGGLDVAVALHRDTPDNLGTVAEEPMLWIGSADWRDRMLDAGGLDAGGSDGGRPAVPLALFEPPCSFRTAALDALSASGLPHRIAVTSPSLAGLRAAAEAGVGLTVRTRHSLTGPLLCDVGRALSLPPLPTAAFCLYARRDEAWPARDDFLELCRRLG
ncbi:LysR substrate-binding domain-containing protein [Azospirillum lipoferum]|uniref:Transcriptional regulator, LysR family n=1 Tax=Azospirillum lipoferum (strain 4B) TaxID=862719 RepID=G7ZFY3_AZOL4|nr:LysR substrate-binding domain-containing protein [Azospirillum lipoferum]CBS90596.1 Transcriptional regulator, LysR family [Azospirillum lipoferum 4B]